MASAVRGQSRCACCGDKGVLVDRYGKLATIHLRYWLDKEPTPVDVVVTKITSYGVFVEEPYTEDNVGYLSQAAADETFYPWASVYAIDFREDNE